jgi:hypothetical protein
MPEFSYVFLYIKLSTKTPPPRDIFCGSGHPPGHFFSNYGSIVAYKHQNRNWLSGAKEQTARAISAHAQCACLFSLQMGSIN